MNDVVSQHGNVVFVCVCVFCLLDLSLLCWPRYVLSNEFVCCSVGCAMEFVCVCGLSCLALFAFVNLPVVRSVFGVFVSYFACVRAWCVGMGACADG